VSSLPGGLAVTALFAAATFGLALRLAHRPAAGDLR